LILGWWSCVSRAPLRSNMAFACSNVRLLAAICAYAAISLSIAIFVKFGAVGASFWNPTARRLESPPPETSDVAVPADTVALASLRFERLAQAILARNESKGGESLELPSHYFHVFDDVSCQGPFPSVAQAREELKKSMSAPPVQVIEAMVQQGISQQQTTSKTFRDNLDSTPMLSSASYYLAAVHTTFDPKSASYSVCAAVTALEFKPTLAISRYTEVVHTEVDGEENCHCSMSSCSQCAVLRPRTASLPEFKPEVLSLEQQLGFGSWLEMRVANLIMKSLAIHVVV